MREFIVSSITITLTVASLAAVCCCSQPVVAAANGDQLLATNTDLFKNLILQSSSDAPKFYSLNAQLYKKSSGAATPHSSTSDLRPLDGARINPRDGTVGGSANDFASGSAADDDDDEQSSIDSLVKAMRRQRERNDAAAESGSSMRSDDRSSLDAGDGVSGPREGVMMDPRRVGGLSPEDEATIQRKSTKIGAPDEGSSNGAAVAAASSRLRHNEPRRKRRASARHTPPKLKSRRVSRNSRRRKLRHGIKPKRRA